MTAERKTGRPPLRAIPAWRRSRRRRRDAARTLPWTGLASLALHLALLAGIIFAALHHPAHAPTPQREVRVALVLQEQKSAGRPEAPAAPAPRPPMPRPPVTHPPAPRPPIPPAPAPPPPIPPAPVAPPPGIPSPAARPVPPRPAPRTAAPGAAPADHPAPAPAPPSPAALPPPAPPAPPGRSGFQFNLGGTNSETNAIVHGDAVVPAKPDARFRNLEPVYPDAAARRGEQGTVVLLIHVAPDGRASQVDVLRSSGFDLLDRAAEQAVARWHFLPAVRDGQAVAASMPLQVVFSLR